MTTTGINPIQAMICPCCGHAVPATPAAPTVPLPTVGGGGGVGALEPNAVTPAPLAAQILDPIGTPDTTLGLPGNTGVQLEPVPVPIPLPDIPGGGWPTAVRPRTPAEVFGEPLFDFAEWGLLPPWLGTAIGGPPEPRDDTAIAGINLPLTTPLTQWP